MPITILQKGSPPPVFRVVSVVLSVLCLLSVSRGADLPPNLDLSARERTFIAEHPVVRLAPDPDFPPIEYLDKDGRYSGIAADFVRLLEKKLPLKFEIVRLDNWSEIIRQARNRQIDILGAAAPTPERLKYMSFSLPYAEFPAVVLVKDSAEEFPTLSELKGKRVAVVKNYADHEFMQRAYPQIPLEVMPDISSGLRQVSFGKVDAMILNLASASYFIQKDGITNLKITEDTDFVFDLSFASRNDWPELASIIRKGMALITPAEKKHILDKWIALENRGWKPSPMVVTSVLMGILLLVMVAILNWNRILKRQVRERTIDLENELIERIQAEEEKARLQQQVHQAKKIEALGLLAGGVAHDLNNILSGTVGYSDLAMRKISKDDPLYEFFQEIRESGRRAAEVVADMLTISRDAVADRQVVNLNDVITDYFASPEHKTLAGHYPDMVFKLMLSDELMNLSCSVIHLKKSLMNLVINAAEATKAGTVTIETKNLKMSGPVAGHEDIVGGDFVQLAISDTGSGIEAEDLEHIFDPFYTKKKLGRSGTGLGLTVVWNTVQEHSGFIDVVPLAAGTRFELNFPATASPRFEKKDDGQVVEVRGQGEHILVVDDEKEVRILAERLLHELGYRVSVAASGEEGVAFLQENKADLVILDMLMEPGMNGYETYRRISEFLPHQKAIIASGFSDGINVKLAQSLGAGAYVKKPYTLDELAVAVRRELSR